MEEQKSYLYLEIIIDIIDNLYDGVYLVDKNRRISFWNKAAEKISGYTKEDMTGKYCDCNLLCHVDKDGRQLCVSGCPLYATIIDGHQRKDEVFLRHKEGYRVPVQVNIFPIKENNKIIGAVEIFTPSVPDIDLDAHNASFIERLSDLATNDQFTGLPNGKKIESYLEYKFHELQKLQSKFCLVFVDMDDFNAFNNTHGRDMGDRVLKNITKSFKLSLNKGDFFGRWGDDKFIGIFDIKHDYEATLIAEKIRILVESSEFFNGGARFATTASIGVSIVRKNDTSRSLIKRAQTLMRESKQKNKNCVTADII